jgi:hypothetical protein
VASSVVSRASHAVSSCSSRLIPFQHWNEPQPILQDPCVRVLMRTALPRHIARWSAARSHEPRRRHSRGALDAPTTEAVFRVRCSTQRRS